MVGDELHAADHVCLLSYRVGTSDIDLLSDLNCVVDLDAEVAHGAAARQSKWDSSISTPDGRWWLSHNVRGS